MTPELEALTFLLLLRHAAVPNPPRVSRWQSVSCDELSDLHFVYAEAIHGELSAVQTLLAQKSLYDWQGLRNSLPVVKGMWYSYVRRNSLLPTSVLAAIDCVHRRLRVPVTPFMDAPLNWDYQCSIVVAELHARADHDGDSMDSSSNVRVPAISEADRAKSSEVDAPLGLLWLFVILACAVS